METQSRKISVQELTSVHLKWFVEIAATDMLRYEVKRPELICKEQLYVLAEKGMNDKTAFVVLSGNEPVGAIGGLLIPNLFNPNILTLTEIFWYVLPEYRKTRAGYLLLKAFEKCGERYADETNMCLLVDSPISIESLEKRGFELKELSFRKES